MNTEIEINGVALPVDFMDADFMDVFEPAIMKLQQDISRSKGREHQSVAVGYRELNQCVETFFDAVWGQDASGRVFCGSKNVMAHLEAVTRIDAAYKEEKKRFNDFSNRYTQRQRQNGFQPGQGRQKKQPHNRP